MDLFECQFPGNSKSLEGIVNAISTNSVIALTGAGTSIPALPSWGTLVAKIIDDAEANGLIEKDIASALRHETSDYLFVIDEVARYTGQTQVKTMVADLFSGLEEPTAVHTAIMQTNYKKFMTLNYDCDLEMAAAKQFGKYFDSIHAGQQTELLKWDREQNLESYPRILHWHGKTSDTESIVLSGEDYTRFYGNSNKNIEFLKELFRKSSIILIGFGFSDPFIITQLNTVMQPLPTNDSHFAIIGIQDDQKINVPLWRRKYQTKYKTNVVFYPVGISNGVHDHSELLSILGHLSSICPVESDLGRENVGELELVSSEKRVANYRNSLFFVGDKQIYCEPTIWSCSVDRSTVSETRISVSALVSLEDHCSIIAPHEFGLSTLGHRIENELEALGQQVLFKDARDIPNYRKKIVRDIGFSKRNKDENFTLIVDNFSSVEHQRMLRELLAVFSGIRLIVLQRHSLSSDILDDEVSELGFLRFQLRGFSRADIRSVIEVTAQGSDSDSISAIVDKVYSDLLQLCIPLTPSNVIMYARVVCKDGTFSPVSRLHIIERFITEALQRASDAYSDAFNAASKIDLIAAFCFNIFQNGMSKFTRSNFQKFCKDYQSSTLSEFNSSEILGDLAHGKIVVHYGENYYFRYKIFFSYFVGLKIASDRDILKDCLENNWHFELDGVVEVLCGMLPDSSVVLNFISDKLEDATSAFYKEYPISDLDLHDGIVWEREKDETSIWESISKKVDEGPVDSSALDKVKTSLQAERRTNDQNISINQFLESEDNVARISVQLDVALNSAKLAKADAKIRAMNAAVGSNKLAYEVATIFSPLIARRKYVSWNGFAFINLIDENNVRSSSSEDSCNLMEAAVASLLPSSIARATADTLGIRKHGKVFLAILQDTTEPPLVRYFFFVLVLRSKPVGWLDAAKKVVSETKRDDIYLRHMLNAALHQFRCETNTAVERKQLKYLIAAICVRRDTKVKSPDKSLIKKAIGDLDAMGYWKK